MLKDINYFVSIVKIFIETRKEKNKSKSKVFLRNETSTLYFFLRHLGQYHLPLGFDDNPTQLK